MPHPTYTEWLAALTSLGPRFGIEPDDYKLKSPTFRLGGWRVGVEHQRNFESVVVQWTKSDSAAPAPPEHWATCPRSDRQKGWLYRVSVRPENFDRLLQELRAAPPDIEAVLHTLDDRVAKSLTESSASRRARIAARDNKPVRIQVTATVFDRDADVVAEVLARANGVCELCKSPAPFTRRSNGTWHILRYTMSYSSLRGATTRSKTQSQHAQTATVVHTTPNPSFKRTGLRPAA